MIGEGDDVGGGIKSREDQMTQSEQSGLSNLSNLVDDVESIRLTRRRETDIDQKSFTCVKVETTLPSLVEERKAMFLKLSFSFHNGFGTASIRGIQN